MYWWSSYWFYFLGREPSLSPEKWHHSLIWSNSRKEYFMGLRSQIFCQNSMYKGCFPFIMFYHDQQKQQNFKFQISWLVLKLLICYMMGAHNCKHVIGSSRAPASHAFFNAVHVYTQTFNLRRQPTWKRKTRKFSASLVPPKVHLRICIYKRNTKPPSENRVTSQNP